MNGPLRSRWSMIAVAVAGPMPGRVSSSSAVARFRSTGPVVPVPDPEPDPALAPEWRGTAVGADQGGLGHLTTARQVEALTVGERRGQVHPVEVGLGGGTAGLIEQVGDAGVAREAVETRSADGTRGVHDDDGRGGRGGRGAAGRHRRRPRIARRIRGGGRAGEQRAVVEHLARSHRPDRQPRQSQQRHPTEDDTGDQARPAAVPARRARAHAGAASRRSTAGSPTGHGPASGPRAPPRRAGRRRCRARPRSTPSGRAPFAAPRLGGKWPARGARPRGSIRVRASPRAGEGDHRR